MRYGWVLAVSLTLWPPGAAAEERAAVRPPLFPCEASSCNARAPLLKPVSVFPDFSPSPTWWEMFQEESRRVLAEYERHPLERYHYVHNDRLHPVVVRLVTGYYSDRSYFFRHWYSSAKGLTPLKLAAGRLWLGIEFRRVLVFHGDRWYSGPFPTPEPCYAMGITGSPLCYSMTSFREGDRRYGVKLRFDFLR